MSQSIRITTPQGSFTIRSFLNGQIEIEPLSGRIVVLDHASARELAENILNLIGART